MSQQTNEPLRGEAAFRAAKGECRRPMRPPRSRTERAAENAAALARRRQIKQAGKQSTCRGSRSV